MESVIIWGVVDDGKKECHYCLYDGPLTNESEARKMAEQFKLNGFIVDDKQMRAKYYGIVIFIRQEFPLKPIIRKKILIY